MPKLDMNLLTENGSLIVLVGVELMLDNGACLGVVVAVRNYVVACGDLSLLEGLLENVDVRVVL
jgi:hypothetical protein